ncbi:LOW QUALITY PROTEIN: putative E3 ubiquitin-protein ligase MID2 [Mantella aurantiaca]
MASADLRAELQCSVCLNIYTDPVMLKCGHNYCQVCIDRVLDTQGGSAGYSCPECRQKFQDRPALQINRKLRNISENFKSAETGQEQSGVFCTHCVDSPVPAIRSCLLCEVSLCDKHLRVHKKSPEHILTDPTSSLESRKCSVHKKILEYYCTEDDICVCVSCCLIGGHKGHKMESLDEASGKKKETLRNVLQTLLTTREETEERVRSLQEQRRKVEEEAAGDTERVTALFIDLRRRLEVLEKRVLREISGRAEWDSMSIVEMIQDLELKKDELSRKMRHIEELCNMTDPLTVLQESDTGDLYILLDVNTAYNNLYISDDRKTVSWSDIKQNRPETPERFQDRFQVLSIQSFSSGRHYLEVDVGGSDLWIFGMCYPSIDRRQNQSVIGWNNKSWGLVRNNNHYRVRHDSNMIPLPANISSNRVRIDLDYEAGRISFYDLCDPIRHLHTFTTTFTEPLHAGLWVGKGCIRISGGIRGFWHPTAFLPSVRYFHSHFPLLLPAMASADLRAELQCSVCLNIYTDPVMLKCGHNYCWVCIDRVLETQEGSGGYSCPECRQKFQDRPALQINRKLRNISENFKSAESGQEQSGIFCTYCVDSPVPAVRSCLLCEVSLCDKHLRVHKKSPEHILIDPTSSLESRKCSVHKKILEYYCTEDHTCVCMSCFAIGGHKGHEMESLNEASGKKKETLRNVLQKLLTTSEETEERVWSLQEHKWKVEEEAAGDTERVTALFIDLRGRLEVLEKRALREISERAERNSMSIEEMIRNLEIKKDELSRKMRHIEELCNMMDPLTVLQESDTGDLCDTEDGDDEDRERHDKLLHDGGGLDVAGILHTGLSDITTEVNVYFPIPEAADILLDVNTANNNLRISDDRKTVSLSDLNHYRPETPERFQGCYPQVLSSQSFSSGRHFWDMIVGGSDRWIVGMCYPSIERRGEQSEIGFNKKSWGLVRYNNQYLVRHDRKVIILPTNISSNRVRIDLDYEAGRISFYDRCDPIRHLHTFTTTFTEPLHAVIVVGRGRIKIYRGNRGM